MSFGSPMLCNESKEGLTMRYFGIFHVMDGERKDPPIEVVHTDQDGTVISFDGEDVYLLLDRAVAEKVNITDLSTWYPGQFYFHEIDKPKAVVDANTPR